MAMPLKKATRESRIADGICQLCPNPLVPGRKYCQSHLDYYKSYRKMWRTENAGPPKAKCSICRQFGHKRGACPKAKTN